MIAFLSGKLIEKQANSVIVDVGGVGYDVSIPLSTFYELGDVGSEVQLRIYTNVREDAIQLFKATGIDTIFENLEGFPADWKTNAPAFIKFVREHQCPSFLEYGEYPYVSAAEIKKALALKQAFSSMLDQMQ